MAKVNIRTPTGAVITVEGSPEEVASIVGAIQPAQRSGSAARSTADKAKKKEAKKQNSVADMIVAFKERGFFDKPKGLGDVKAKLEEGGFLFPLTSLSGVMLSLVKRQLLTRKKVEGVWAYGKR